MNRFLRDFVLPIAVGTVLSLVICQLLTLFSPAYRSVPGDTESTLTIHIYPWLDLAYALLPGFVAGALSKRYSALNGFLASFLGLFIILSFFQTGFSSLSLFNEPFTFLQNCAISGIYGLVSGAAGYMLARALTTQSR